MPYASKEERRRYAREWLAKRRADWFADKSCVRCGKTIDLELDHRDPAQKIDHKIWSWSAKRRDVELAKCQVLCGTCHKEKTAAEKARPLPHGTDSGYTDQKCRCDECRAAHREKRRTDFKKYGC